MSNFIMVTTLEGEKIVRKSLIGIVDKIVDKNTNNQSLLSLINGTGMIRYIYCEEPIGTIAFMLDGEDDE